MCPMPCPTRRRGEEVWGCAQSGSLRRVILASVMRRRPMRVLVLAAVGGIALAAAGCSGGSCGSSDDSAVASQTSTPAASATPASTVVPSASPAGSPAAASPSGRAQQCCLGEVRRCRGAAGGLHLPAGAGGRGRRKSERRWWQNGATGTSRRTASRRGDSGLTAGRFLGVEPVTAEPARRSDW